MGLDFSPFNAYIVSMTDEVKKPEPSISAQPLNPTPIPTLNPNTKGDFEMNTAHHSSNKVMMIAMVVILCVVGAAGIIAITPQVKSIAAQKEEIKSLKAQLAEANSKGEDSSVLQAQLTDVQKKMDAMAAREQEETQNSEMQGQIKALEERFGQVMDESKKLGMAGMVSRVQAMQQSEEGSAIVSSIVNMLAATPDGADVGENFLALKKSDPGVAQITEGVAPEDMKAAAMLIALSQMRHAVARGNDSFDNDLALLKKTVPADNQPLLASIDKLAPQAKYGVLSPSGLSDQFRGMTGDILTASVSGPDVTVKDKMKARLSNVFVVEKNGQRISGNETQIAVSAAQKQLDAGNVQGAVEILQTLNGPAAQQTQPFIDQAQATLTAQTLASQIGASVAQQVRSGVKTLVNGGLPHGVVSPYNAQGISNSIQSVIPGAPAMTTPSQPVPLTPR